MLIKIRRDSIRPNPTAGKDTIEIYGRETHTRTRVWLLFDRAGVSQGLFTVTEQAIGSGLDWHVIAIEQYHQPDWMFTASYAVNYPVQQLYTQPQGAWLYDWENPTVCCVMCQATLPVRQLLTDSLDLDDADGYSVSLETNSKCPHCGEWDCLGEPLTYEQIHQVPKEELPCVSDYSAGTYRPASVT